MENTNEEIQERLHAINYALLDEAFQSSLASLDNHDGDDRSMFRHHDISYQDQSDFIQRYKEALLSFNENNLSVDAYFASDSVNELLARCSFCSGMASSFFVYKKPFFLRGLDLYEALTKPLGILGVDRLVSYLLGLSRIDEPINAVLGDYLSNRYNYIYRRLKEEYAKVGTEQVQSDAFLQVNACSILFNLGEIVVKDRTWETYGRGYCIFSYFNDSSRADRSENLLRDYALEENWSRVTSYRIKPTENEFYVYLFYEREFLQNLIQTYFEFKSSLDWSYTHIGPDPAYELGDKSYSENEKEVRWSSSKINEAFSHLALLKLDSSYTFDCYTYSNAAPESMTGDSCTYFPRVYVHTKETKGIYKPEVKKSLLDIVLRRFFKKLRIKDTEFKDSMKIQGPLHTQENCNHVPSPLAYIHTDKGLFDKLPLAAWQYYLFYRFIKKSLPYVCFSVADVLKTEPGYFSCIEFIHEENTDLEKHRKIQENLELLDKDFNFKIQVEEPSHWLKTVTISFVELTYDGAIRTTVLLAYQEFTGQFKVIKTYQHLILAAANNMHFFSDPRIGIVDSYDPEAHLKDWITPENLKIIADCWRDCLSPDKIDFLKDNFKGWLTPEQNHDLETLKNYLLTPGDFDKKLKQLATQFRISL